MPPVPTETGKLFRPPLQRLRLTRSSAFAGSDDSAQLGENRNIVRAGESAILFIWRSRSGLATPRTVGPTRRCWLVPSNKRALSAETRSVPKTGLPDDFSGLRRPGTCGTAGSREGNTDCRTWRQLIGKSATIPSTKCWNSETSRQPVSRMCGMAVVEAYAARWIARDPGGFSDWG